MGCVRYQHQFRVGICRFIHTSDRQDGIGVKIVLDRYGFRGELGYARDRKSDSISVTCD
nr:MAG TPA: hypothetical protein [Caudoviricetes sp.]